MASAMESTLPVEERRPRRLARTWTGALGGTALALWAPFLVAALASHRVRRVAEDFWLWPGLVPGNRVFDDLYSPWYGSFTLAHLVVWTLVARRFGWPGLVGAAVCGFVSMGNLMALLSI